MSSIDQTLAELRTSISSATQQRARAQVQYDQAQDRLTVAQKALVDEFGVSTTEEAKAMLLTLRSAVDDAIAEARAALELANA